MFHRVGRAIQAAPAGKWAVSCSACLFTLKALQQRRFFANRYTPCASVGSRYYVKNPNRI